MSSRPLPRAPQSAARRPSGPRRDQWRLVTVPVDRSDLMKELLEARDPGRRNSDQREQGLARHRRAIEKSQAPFPGSPLSAPRLSRSRSRTRKREAHFESRSTRGNCEAATVHQSADEAEAKAPVIARKHAVRLPPLICDNDLQLVGDLTHVYVHGARPMFRIGVADNVVDRLADAELDSVELRVRETAVACAAGDGVAQRPDGLRSSISAQQQHRFHFRRGIPARRGSQTRSSGDLMPFRE